MMIARVIVCFFTFIFKRCYSTPGFEPAMLPILITVFSFLKFGFVLMSLLCVLLSIQ